MSPSIAQLQTFSVKDNITDIVGNVNELHGKIENNAIAIESLRDIKENGKYLFCQNKINVLSNIDFFGMIVIFMNF